MLNNKFLPNFILIGAGKSGTSSLADYLQQHPEIYMTSPKELNYFAFSGEKLEKYNNQDQQWIKNSITNINEYHKIFSQVSNEKAIGEASGIYLFHPQAAQRIKDCIPNVRLMAILRNPIDRAYSGYQMHVRKKTEKRDFIQVIKEDLVAESIPYMTGSYLQKGLYFHQLTRYFELFNKNQIKVFLYEDLCEQPAHLLKNIYSFLNVDTKFCPDLENKVNVAPSYTKQLSLKNREYLLSLCKDDIIKLQELINRDLSSWMQI